MANLNKLNQNGVPLHACNGYRQDEHYWAWVQWISTTCTRVGRSADGLTVFYKKEPALG